MAHHSINVDLLYKIDRKELDSLMTDLQSVRIGLAPDEKSANKLTGNLKEAYQTALQLDEVLESAWNPKLNQLDLSKVQKGIQTTWGSVSKLQESLAKSGEKGTAAFDNFSRAVLKTNNQIKQSSKLLDDLAESFGNTIKWGISSSIFNTLTGAIQKAFDYSVNLDNSLNDIRIVTGQSADEMERFAKIANDSAKNLGASTLDYTEAALIYYQQGLGDEEAQARADITLKTANVTGQSAQTVSEQLTAVWNGYKVSAEEAELYVDKLAAVAASTASDLEELSTGMSKVASAANLMGVDVDQLNATLATVVSVTRQAPESVGTAFKTIYARMGDIEAGLDTETTLGNYTEKMKEIAGINVLDTNGQLRDMGEVIEEVGAMWTTLSREQQVALSQAMAGTRQYNNLLSLFDNWDMYEEALKTSANAAGTLNEQQSIYMETTEAHLQKLRTTAEETYDILFDTETVNTFVDTFTAGFSVINNYLKGFGGGMESILGLATTATTIFNKQIGAAIGRSIQNKEIAKENKSTAQLQTDIVNAHVAQGQHIGSKAAAEEVKYAERRLKIQSALTEEQNKAYIAEQQKIGILQDQIDEINEYKNIALELREQGLMIFTTEDALTTEDFDIAIQKSEERQAELASEQDAIEELIIEYEKLQNAENAKAEADRAIQESKEKYSKLKDVYDNANVLTAKDLGNFGKNAPNENQISLSLGDIGPEVPVKENVALAVEVQKLLEEHNFAIAKGKTLEQDLAKAKNETKNAQDLVASAAKKYAKDNVRIQEVLLKLENNEQVSKEELNEIVKEINKEYQKQINNQKKITEGSVKLQQTIDGVPEALEKEKEQRGKILDQQAEQYERQQKISNIVASVSSFTTLTTAIQGITQAFADGEMSAEDWKMAISTIIGNLPVLITGWNALVELQEKQKEQKIKDAAAKTANVAATVAETAATEVNTQAKQTNANIAKKSAEETAKEAQAHVGNAVSITAETTGQTAANTAKKTGVGVTKSLDKVLKKLNLTLLASPYFWLAAAIMAVVGALTYFNAKNEAARESIIKESEATIEKNKIKQEETQQVLDSIDAYDKMYQSYQQGLSSKEQLNEQSLETIQLLGDENLEVLALTGNYQALAKEIDNYRIKKLKEQQETVKDSKQAAASAIEANAPGLVANGRSVSITTGIHQGDVNEEEQFVNILKENMNEDYFVGGYQGNGIWNIDYGFDVDAETIVDFYKELDKAIKIAEEDMSSTQKTQSGLLADARKLRDELAEGDYIKTYLEQEIQISVIGADIIAAEANWSEANSYAGWEELYDKVFNKIKDEFKNLTEEEIEKAIAEAISNESGETQEGYQSYTKTKSVIEKFEGSTNFGETGKEMFGNYIMSHGVDNQIISGILQADPEELQKDFDTLYGYAKETSPNYGKTDAQGNMLPLWTEEEKLQVYNDIFEALGEKYRDTTVALVALTDADKELLKELGYSEENFEEYVKQLQNTYPELKNNATLTKELAIANVKLNKGYEDLQENFEDIEKVLREGRTETSGYAKALDQLKGILSNLLNIDADKLSNEFYTSKENLDLMKKAAEGDLDAIKKLKEAAGDDLIKQIKADTDDESIKKELDKLDALVDNYDTSDLTYGAEIDDQDFINDLNEMIFNARMTKGQVEDYLNAMEIDPEFEVDMQDITTTQTHTAILPEALGGEEFSWTTTETVQVPKIKSLNYIGGLRNGGINTKSSGGKGGSGSEPAKVDLTEDTSDRYHDVDVELKKIANSLEKVQNQTEKLAGSDYIDNLREQYKLLNDEITTTEEKIKIAKKEQKELQAKLAKQGVTFNSDGTMANYFDAYEKQLAALNKIENKYNNMSKKRQEKYQETYDKAKEDFEKFVENMSRYDEVLTDLIPGLLENNQDALDKQTELKLDAFHYEIDLRIEMGELTRDWNKFKNQILNDLDDENILGNTLWKFEDVLSYFKDGSSGVIQENTQHINEIIDQLQQMKEIGDATLYDNNKATLLEDLQEYYEQLTSDLTDIHELSEEIRDSYVEMLDQAQEKFDEQVSTFETINDLLEHDKNVIQMIYGEESYATLSQFYDKQEENYNKQLDFQKQQVEFWRAQMDTAEEGSDAWEAAKENWLSAVDEWNAAVETAIENLQDKYLNAINAIFQKLNNDVTGGLGLDYIESQWDLINRNADEYLDSVNAIYNVQQLQSKYLDAIEKADSPAQQKKLNDLMEKEMEYLREQDKLSQYDIDRANLKYEIALKQMALEEAQQNKTQLRLRRDSQGNYTYQYTADDDQVSSVQQEIANLYNQLYNLDSEEYRGNLEGLYDVWVEFQEKMAEAAQINDPEQRAAKELLIKEQYGELINTLAEKNELIQSNLNQSTMSHLFDLYNQNIENYDMMTSEQQAILNQFMTEETDFTNAAFDNLFNLYNTTVENFQGMSNAQRDILMGSIVPQWETAIQAMADKFVGEGGFIPVCSDAFNQLDTATKNYDLGLEELQKQAGISFDDMAEGLNDNILKTQQLLIDNGKLIDKYTEETLAIKGVLTALGDLEKQYGKVYDAAKKAAEEGYKTLHQEQDENANVDSSLTKPSAETKSISETPKAQPEQNPLGFAASGAPIIATYKIKKGDTLSSIGAKYGVAWRSIYNENKSIIGGNPNLIRIGKTLKIPKYASGGYTGDWAGSSGQLAMLHKKELVLNANDTKNMLNAIEIVRDITSNLGATLMGRMAGISAAGAYGGDSGILEQNVHITAEFPNVENSHEIEDALNNLINKASQYIQK